MTATQATASNGVSYDVKDGVAVLVLDNPPVNALSHQVRIALRDGVERALQDDSADALVIACAGRTFFAGADVKELGRPIEPPLLGDVMTAFEAASKPIICAMHGTPLGGGLEIALAAHFRVAVPSTHMGLPEADLGLLPGAGGTQRLPRMIGVGAALDMIALSQKITAEKALELGVIDAVVREDQMIADAVDFARGIVDENRPLGRVRDISMAMDEAELERLFAAFREQHQALFVGLKAAAGAIETIRAAATLPFEEGLKCEKTTAQALTASPESAAQRHLFFAERAARKWPRSHERVNAPPMRLSGSWKEANNLVPVDDGIQESGAGLILADDAMFDDYRDLVVKSRARPLVTTHFCDRIEDLAAAMADPSPLVGVSVRGGVWEIHHGARTAAQSALAVMALAQKARRSAIFVRADHGVVNDRIEAALKAGMAQAASTGTSDTAIAAALQAYGFDPFRLGGKRTAGTDDSDGELIASILAPAHAEAKRIIDEGTVFRASDIDLACVRSGLWPLWRGGPAFGAG